MSLSLIVLGRGFVNKSEMFALLDYQSPRIVSAATASRTERKQILKHFLFNVDSSNQTFLVTDLLSQNTFVGMSIGILHIRSLYLKATIKFLACLKAIKSDPKVPSSMEF